MTYDSSERYTTRGPRAERVQSAGSANLRKNKPLSGRSIAIGMSSELEWIGNAHTRKSTKCELLALQAFAVCCCHHVLKTSKLISALASSDTSARICVTHVFVIIVFSKRSKVRGLCLKPTTVHSAFTAECMFKLYV